MPLIALNLAEILVKQAKDTEAEKLYHKLLPNLPEVKEKSARLLEARGVYYARRARWKEAAADLARVIELRPADLAAWHSLAAVVVQDGNVDAYREHCRKSLARFGKSTDAQTRQTIAIDCLILPASAADLRIIGPLPENLASANENDASGLLVSTKALGEYRQGRFADAVDASSKALLTLASDSTKNTASAVSVQAQLLAVLAMAHWQRKEPDLAHAALAKAAEIVGTPMQKPGNDDRGEDWAEGIIAQALVREAKTLIDGK